MNIACPLTKKSFFSRYFHAPLNSTIYNSTILEKIERSYINTNISADCFQDIQKLEVTNPLPLIIVLFIFKLAQICGLRQNLPFRSFKSFKKYILHLPPGTHKLFNMMIYIHIISIVLWLIYPDSEKFIVVLFGANTYFTFVNLQIWRPITSVFLHADVLHLFSNMFEFILCGPFFEKHVTTTFFYFHIYFISILNSIIEGVIHLLMFFVGITDRIQVYSVGFSGVIFSLFVIAGDVARKRRNGRNRRSNHHHHKNTHFFYHNNNLYWDYSPSSSSSSASPSNVYLPGFGVYYDEFISNELVPWYVLISSFLLSPSSSFTAHFSGIIVGLLYVNYLEPNNLLPRNENTVSLFNVAFPVLLLIYAIIYSFSF